MKKTTQKENILWIDIAKFIGIFLVIITHTIGSLGLLNIGLPKYINGFCNLFYMPLFFVLIGYLYKEKPVKESYIKILYSLLIPYIIYQLLYLPFVLGNNILYHHADFGETLIKILGGIVLGDIFTENSFFITCCFPCWFIMVAIQLRFLFAHIKLSLKNILITIILTIGLLKLLIFYHVDLYFVLDNTLIAIPYFLFGYYLKNYTNFNDKLTNISLSKTFLLIITSIITLLSILKINSFIIYARVIYNIKDSQSLFLVFLAGIIGTLMIILFSNLFKKENNFVKTISQNTLFIIYFHFQIIFILNWIKIKDFFIAFKDNNLINIIIILVLSGINLIINYYVIKILEKRVPLILGRGNKNVSN